MNNGYNNYGSSDEKNASEPIVIGGRTEEPKKEENPSQTSETQQSYNGYAQQTAQNFEQTAQNYGQTAQNYGQTAQNYAYTAQSYAQPREKEKNNGKSSAAWIILVCLVISLLGGFGAGYGASAIIKQRNSSDGTVSTEGGNYNPVVLYRNVAEKIGDTEIAEGTPASVAKAVENSVVEIATETVVTGSFFGQYVTDGAGSGVVVSEDGYIATNNHVIDGAEKVTVRLKNGEEYEAKVIGADSESDIAVIKIEATGLTPVVFGDSANVNVGETVIAVGNPLGSLGGSVSCGIVSALDREITIDGQKMTLMQTDTAVNPGNSGGGLFNLKGELIGIVNAKNYGDAVEGLGFAIPAATAEKTVGELIEYGYVRGRADLGLTLLDVSDTMTAAYYRLNNYGCYVIKSAYTDELKQWDRITAINGNAVTYYSDIAALKSSLNVGDTITITVVRDGKVIDVSLVVREKTPDQSEINFET